MKQNILIIGGSYFIGRVFVEELLKLQKFSIYVLNRGKMPLRKKARCILEARILFRRMAE